MSLLGLSRSVAIGCTDKLILIAILKKYESLWNSAIFFYTPCRCPCTFSWTMIIHDYSWIIYFSEQQFPNMTAIPKSFFFTYNWNMVQTHETNPYKIGEMISTCHRQCCIYWKLWHNHTFHGGKLYPHSTSAFDQSLFLRIFSRLIEPDKFKRKETILWSPLAERGGLISTSETSYGVHLQKLIREYCPHGLAP